MSKTRIEIEASPEPARGGFVLNLTADAPAGWQGRSVSLLLGEWPLARLTLGEAGPVKAPLDLRILARREDYVLHIRDETGAALDDAADWSLKGEFFEALRVSPENFLDKVQLHHSRFRSAPILEMAAHAFYLNHPEAEFVLRAAALTILSHRYLEKPADSLSEAETARVAWILDEAGTAVPEGAALVRAAEEAGSKVDWRHVRWTVSLATVAAHLSLYDESYEPALSFFELAVRHTHLVHYAKVSALNLVICAFAGGIVAHMLGKGEQAKTLLVQGVESVKPIVQAQDLMENVWVLGDLQNVLRAARQSYIALVRMKVIETRVSPPVIDDNAQIETGQVKSPLQKIILSGRVPRLQAHLAEYGAR